MKLKLFVAISFICGFALAFSGCTGNTDPGVSDPYSGYENVSFKISDDFQEGLNFLNAEQEVLSEVLPWEEEKMKQMFISCILNAGGKHEQI